MRCFGNGKPNLSASQSTRNKGDSVIYTHMKNLYKEEKCQNANASLILDRGGYLRKANSFASRRSALYGHALCAPCDLSSCACLVAVSNAFLDTLSEETGLTRALVRQQYDWHGMYFKSRMLGMPQTLLSMLPALHIQHSVVPVVVVGLMMAKQICLTIILWIVVVILMPPALRELGQ